jgi:hypothetical protein
MPDAPALRLLSLALSLLVSLVSLLMAVKGLAAREWLPFHEAAAGVGWQSLAPRVQRLLVFLVRLAGLGFLALFLLLAAVPTYLCWHPDRFLGLASLGVGAVYCIGLGVLAHRLHHETGARTPWKKSFLAAGALALAALLSV